MISGPHFQRPKSPNWKALGGVISSFFLGWGEQGWPRARSFSSIHQRLAISLLMRKGLKRDAVRSQWSWSHLAERTARRRREIQWTPPKKKHWSRTLRAAVLELCCFHVTNPVFFPSPVKRAELQVAKRRRWDEREIKTRSSAPEPWLHRGSSESSLHGSGL